LQCNGGYVEVYSGSNPGDYTENVHFPNHRGRMRNSRGIYFRSLSAEPKTYIKNCSAVLPRIVALTPKKSVVNAAGGSVQEGGTSDGFVVSGQSEEVVVDSPYLEGFSHAGVGFNPYSYSDHYVVPAENNFNPNPIYVWGEFDGSDFTGRRSFWISLGGTFSGTTVTLQKSASLAGPWTDVQSWTSNPGAQFMFNDGASDDVYYRIGVKTGEMGDGAPTVRLRSLAYPRNCAILASTYENDASTIVCASDTSMGEAGDVIYARGFGMAGVRNYVGPIRVKNQTIQCQFAGDVFINGPSWDNTCIQYSDREGVNNWNCGNLYKSFAISYW
jgi:hypothetical protein